jgi:hypothetical protein
MKNVVTWDVTPWGSYTNRRFGGTYGIHHRGGRIRALGTKLEVTANSHRNFGPIKSHTVSHPRRRHSSPIISLEKINHLVFVKVILCVFCQEETQNLYVIFMRIFLPKIRKVLNVKRSLEFDWLQSILHRGRIVWTYLILCKIWGFHGGDYEEWRLLGYYAVWLL